ncbi:MAG: DUF4363 family protein [Oscillospiraceae bacterium]|jgi:hypothetical protein|nr:DUF4363 family protein [Oscillospiraceae bacterium]
MKYLVAAILILSCVLAFCIFSFYKLDSAVGELLNIIASAEESASSGDMEKSYEYTKTAVSLWTDKEILFAALLNHDQFNNIPANLEGMLRCSEEGSKSGLLSYLITLRADLEQIISDETLTLKNLF